MNDVVGKRHKEKVINAAISEYENSICFGFSSSTEHAIDMMEEAYFMCTQCPYTVNGIACLKEKIQSAHTKYKNVNKNTI